MGEDQTPKVSAKQYLRHRQHFDELMRRRCSQCGQPPEAQRYIIDGRDDAVDPSQEAVYRQMYRLVMDELLRHTMYGGTERQQDENYGGRDASDAIGETPPKSPPI